MINYEMYRFILYRFRMGPNVDTGDEMGLHIGYENELVAWSKMIACCCIRSPKTIWNFKNINIILLVFSFLKNL